MWESARGELVLKLPYVPGQFDHADEETLFASEALLTATTSRLSDNKMCLLLLWSSRDRHCFRGLGACCCTKIASINIRDLFLNRFASITELEVIISLCGIIQCSREKKVTFCAAKVARMLSAHILPATAR